MSQQQSGVQDDNRWPTIVFDAMDSDDSGDDCEGLDDRLNEPTSKNNATSSTYLCNTNISAAEGQVHGQFVMVCCQ